MNEEIGLLIHLCMPEIELSQCLVVCQTFEQLLPTILKKDERGWLEVEVQNRNELLLFPPPQGNFCCFSGMSVRWCQKG